MLASYQWLKALSGVDIPATEVAERLTSAGLEVEGLEVKGDGLEHVVVAEVRSIRPHPNRDKLRLVTVFDGTEEQEVVCGAPNVPEPGGRVLLAKLGATLPGGFEIAERELGGVVSRGMLCSESELGIGPGGEGIFVFGAQDPDVALGTEVADALGLRDVIFEIGLTPNRPDGLGHIGLARELALLSNVEFQAPRVAAPSAVAKLSAQELDAILPPDSGERFDIAAAWEGAPAEERAIDAAVLEKVRGVRVSIDDAVRCPRYGAALVLGAKVGPSPFWLRYRLQNLGVRSISNLVDATNLVLLEFGHPIHGFDLSFVRGNEIRVRTAAEGEVMQTLDEQERTLTTDDLLICDGEGPVALAGVMGGLDSELRESTEHVLIECAYFQPQSVRRTSRRVGLHTDASHRFERGVDPRAVRDVLVRSAQLIADLGGGAVVSEGVDVAPGEFAPRTIRLRHERVPEVLGLEIPRDTIRRVLKGIGCDAVREDDGGFEVDAPTFRPDLGREIDLVEEVARVHGFDHIPARTPRVRPSDQGTPERIRFRNRVMDAAASTGLHQAVSYRFVSPTDLERSRVDVRAVPLANPLSEERSVMRTSLLPSLLSAAEQAMRHQTPTVALFEVGRTFHPRELATADDEGDALLPVEREHLAFVLVGQAEAWLGETRDMDFYDAKGRLEALVYALLGHRPELVADDALADSHPSLHPRRRAAVRLGDITIGAIGEVHPEVVDAYEVDARPQYAELSLRALSRAVDALGVAQARALPRFPAATRDVALLLADTHAAGDVAAMIAAEAPHVEDVSVFDVYRGDQIPEGHRSVALRVTYRDPEGTLKDKKVDKAHAAVVAKVEAAFDAKQR